MSAPDTRSRPSDTRQPSNYSELANEVKPAARLYVNGEEIPIINEGVTTTATTDGPLGINKLTEAYIPSEWMDEQYLDRIKASKPNESDLYQPAEIQYYDENTEKYVTYHRGFVIGIGGGSKGSKEHRIRIADLGQLFKYIPFNQKYEAGADIQEVVGDVMQEFNEYQPVFDIVDVVEVSGPIDENFEETRSFANPLNNIDSIVEEGVTFIQEELIVDNIKAGILNTLDFFGATDHIFDAHSDSLMDAMEFIHKKVDGEFYFSPTTDNHNEISLVYSDEEKTDFRAKHLDEDGQPTYYRPSTLPSPTVIENNAIYEIQPINTLRVLGKPDRNMFMENETIRSAFDEYADQTIPFATAKHKELEEKAGGEFTPPAVRSDATTVEVAEAEARNQLKDSIMGGADGKILMKLFPFIHPYDSLRSQMACGDNVETEYAPFDYTINSVVHKAGYDEEMGEFFKTTKLSVNQYISNTDIDIVESGEKNQADIGND